MKTQALFSTLLRTLRTLGLGAALAVPALAVDARADDPAIEKLERIRSARLAAFRKAKQEHLARTAEQAAVSALRDTYVAPTGTWIASPAPRAAAKRAS